MEQEQPQSWSGQWKIAALLVGLLILIGLGVALRGPASQNTVSSLFGIQSVPSLSGSVEYSGDLPQDARDILETTIADLRDVLAEDEANYDTWLSLAIRYKQAGDLAKAKEVWEYLASIHPDDVVSRHNLADLHHHFLTDYPKAEKYYLESIELAPLNSLDYLALHELYRYSYKQDTDAAEQILLQGIGQVSDNQPIDLYIALANYYADKGEREKARESFAEARTRAEDAGNADLVVRLDAAIAALEG